MRVGARRWTLRHESRPYGAQQARNLCNARKRDRGILGALLLKTRELLPSEKSSANKWWVIRVAAAAVIPEPQVVTAIIGFKASVAGLISSWLNLLLNRRPPGILSG